MQTILLQILVFQLCFLIVYELLLRKETFFNWNRGYLLVTSIVSLVLPFIKLKSFSKVIPNEFIISLPAVILGEQNVVEPTLIKNVETAIVNSEQTSFSIVWIWYIGILVFTGILLYKLFKIWRFKHTNNSIQKKGYSITILKNSEDAFSFLKSIFLGDKIESTQKESILKHEKVHVEERHTLDLLWFELMRIVFWFNPLVYIYQKRITEVHEFIADKRASKHQQNYYENLLAKTFNIAQFSVVNQFYSSSLIKKRIIMLTKEKSNKTKLVKYITIIPIVLSMLVYVSCSDALEIENNTEVTAGSETTVLEDVYRMVNEELSNNTLLAEISDSDFDKITKKLKGYSVSNKLKIEKTDFTKYQKYAISVHYEGKTMLEYSEKDWEFEVFKLGEKSVRTLIKESIFADKNDCKSAMALLTSSMFKMNKLEELNFILPNEEELKIQYEAKMKRLYEDYLNNVSIETEEVNKDYSNQAEVPFSVIDQSPIYPGCDENATFEALKKCFSKGIAKHINENFNTDIGKKHNLKGRQKIYISFKVDKLGRLKDVKARAPHEVLKTEVIRVMNTLPELKPGMHNGKVVTVPFSIPVIFEVN